MELPIRDPTDAVFIMPAMNGRLPWRMCVSDGCTREATCSRPFQKKTRCEGHALVNMHTNCVSSMLDLHMYCCVCFKKIPQDGFASMCKLYCADDFVIKPCQMCKQDAVGSKRVTTTTCLLCKITNAGRCAKCGAESKQRNGFDLCGSCFTGLEGVADAFFTVWPR